jgi:hypothetical protein
MTWTRVESPSGAKVFFRVERNSLENVIVGHMDLDVALRLQREFDRVREAHGTFRGFHYWSHAPSYDTDYRRSWVEWLTRQNGALVETHFLTSSRLVRMGLAVANIAYPRIQFVVHRHESTYAIARRPYMSDVEMPTPVGSRATHDAR